MNYLETVKEFHDAFGIATPETQVVDKHSLNVLRRELIEEETRELSTGLYNRDREATLDALIDLQYVLSGTVLALGFAGVFDEAFAVVHRANMAKLGPEGRPIYREDGKVLKPEGWQPPDLSPFVQIVG